jgi:hypothetical protein
MSEIEKTIKKVGEELDPDILEWMMGEADDNGRPAKNWEFLHHPVDNMLEWQAMRDRKARNNWQSPIK